MRIKATLFLFILLAASISAQYKTLGSWNSQGVPDYLVTPGDNIDSGLMERINNSLPESVKLPDSHPEYILSSSQGNIVLQEEAEVWVTYITEGAGYLNVLGFYTYDKDNPPASAADIDSSMTIIFPNVSNSGSGGGLNAGDRRA